jgi:hypothetical protein
MIEGVDPAPARLGKLLLPNDLYQAILSHRAPRRMDHGICLRSRVADFHHRSSDRRRIVIIFPLPDKSDSLGRFVMSYISW